LIHFNVEHDAFHSGASLGSLLSHKLTNGVFKKRVDMMAVLKNGSHELQSAQSAQRRQRRQRRCAEVSHHEFETTKGFGTILSGLARSVLCVFFILFHVCTLS